MAAKKILMKMYIQKHPMEDLKVCVETILDSYIEFTKQMTTISNKKIKKMRQGLEIPKPKLLKNGFNYFDKEEILNLPDDLRKYYVKKMKEKTIVGDQLQITTNSFQNLEIIEESKNEMDKYFFDFLTLLYFTIKQKGLETEINLEDSFIVWAIKMKKWSLLLQLSQGGVFTENMSLCLLFCELGSKKKYIDQLKNKFEMIKILKENFLQNAPNLGNKEFLQIGLQYLKKQSR
jgi:hypothetical protein